MEGTGCRHQEVKHQEARGETLFILDVQLSGS